LVSDVTHTITSGEDSANQINLTLSLPSGSYDARARVTDTVGTGLTSAWSNTVVNFTITVVTTTTLDPANKGASQTLSNGNLTTTGNGTNGIARSIASHTTGKYYYEVTIGSVSNLLVGFVNAGESLNAYVGGSVNSLGAANGGGWLGDAGGTTTSATLVNGHVYGLAIDLGAMKAWILDITSGTGQWNANATANPATGVNGCTYGAFGLGFTPPIYAAGTAAANGNNMTFNFGATAYTGTPPSGFGNW
jgi:hypothetical protein